MLQGDDCSRYVRSACLAERYDRPSLTSPEAFRQAGVGARAAPMPFRVLLLFPKIMITVAADPVRKGQQPDSFPLLQIIALRDRQRSLIFSRHPPKNASSSCERWASVEAAALVTTAAGCASCAASDIFRQMAHVSCCPDSSYVRETRLVKTPGYNWKLRHEQNRNVFVICRGYI